MGQVVLAIVVADIERAEAIQARSLVHEVID